VLVLTPIMSLALTEAAELQTSKYVNIGAMAILIFDYVITIEDEARWIWGRSWDATRFIFTVSRYLPFVGTALIAYVALRSNSDPCPSGNAENVIHIIGIVASELLLVLRTYAFWQGNKRLLYGLLAFVAVTIGAVVAVNLSPDQFLDSGTTEPLPSGTTQSSCLLESSRHGALAYVVLLVYEIVILALMVYKRFHAYRGSHALIARIIYRDGIFYVLCIISVTLANVVIDLALPIEYIDLLETAQIVLHSVLASRIMFNLRKSLHYSQYGGMGGALFGSTINSKYNTSSPSTGLEFAELRGVGDSHDVQVV